MAEGRSRADPEDVLPLSAVSLAQAHASPASPTSAAGLHAGLQPLPRERLAEMCPGRPAPAAAPDAARSARGPNARNPVHPEDGRVWVAARPHWRWPEALLLATPTAGEFHQGSPGRPAVSLAISARPQVWG